MPKCRMTETGDAFLERFDAGGKEVLEAFQKEWKRARGWTVPLLAGALVLALLTAPLMGALGQSEFGLFTTFAEKGAVERMLWNRHGRGLVDCSLRAVTTGRVVRCSFQFRPE